MIENVNNSEVQLLPHSITQNNVKSLQCDECEIAFKSNYHLSNHVKSSHHLLKASLNRKFNYKLNKKAVKSKLVNGANKAAFTKEIKSNCIILNFNDGSYHFSVLSTIEDWKVTEVENEGLDCEDISVTDIIPGREQSGLCVDTLLRNSNGS